MRIAKDSLILVGVLVGVVALTVPVSARIVPKPQTPYIYVAPAISDTSATTTTATTTASAPETTTESTTVAQPPAALNNLATQLDSMLKQLVALLTTQLQGLQQQLAVKLGQQQIVTTPSPATTATTTGQTAATPTAVTVENKPPKINLVYPYAGIDLAIPASIDVIASAVDDDGAISKVEFFQGASSLGAHTGSQGPWSVRWSGIGAGTYTLTAKATDDKGGQTTSAPVTLTVKASSQATTGFTDSPPTITIATTMTGTALTATATVATYAGNITNVVWSRAASTTSDAAYVTDATSPYNGNATLATGQHTISAIVTNSQGSQTRTASTTVTTN